MDPTSDDAAIAEFHADAKRRRRRIWAVTSLVCIGIGVTVLVVAFTASQASDRYQYGEGRTFAYGIGFVIAGVAAGVRMFKGD